MHQATKLQYLGQVWWLYQSNKKNVSWPAETPLLFIPDFVASSIQAHTKRQRRVRPRQLYHSSNNQMIVELNQLVISKALESLGIYEISDDYGDQWSKSSKVGARPSNANRDERSSTQKELEFLGRYSEQFDLAWRAFHFHNSSRLFSCFSFPKNYKIGF